MSPPLPPPAAPAAKRRRPQHAEERRRLPVWPSRHNIVRAVRESHVTILVGATGSGKTTQVPQFLDDAGLGPVAIAQPRRVAAVSVAQRVSEEVGCRVGARVGYAVRFDDRSSAARTRIRYATSGVLLREAVADPLFSRYRTLVIDEVHERLLQTDILVAVAKQALCSGRRELLRVVLMSATVDAERLVRYFRAGERAALRPSVRTLSVPGRLYPVDVVYTARPQADYLDAALNAVLQLHARHAGERGDVLVFLTGQEEIESAERLLTERARAVGFAPSAVVAVPLYASMTPAQQARALQALPEPASRKVILATNVAETSITIPNVRYVIDTGVAKQRRLSARTGADVLRVLPISRAQAMQRAGRAGREPPGGACVRLYPESEFLRLAEHPVPEVLRCDVAGTLLHLLALGVREPWCFDFVDAPPAGNVERALVLLHELGAVDDRMRLTDAVGRAMARLPLPPMEAKMVLAAVGTGRRAVVERVLCIAAMLNVDAASAVFVVPRDAQRDESRRLWRSRFVSPADGDLLTLANVLRAYLEQPRARRGEWCQQHFVNARVLQAAVDVRQQLRELVRALVPADGVEQRTDDGGNDNDDDDDDSVALAARRCIVAGYGRHGARLSAEVGRAGAYVTLVGQRLQVDVHPSSMLGREKRPEFIVYHELVLTSRPYVRGVTPVERDWLDA